MSRPNPAIFALFLLALVGALAVPALMPGALFVSRHEGDALHLLDILARIDLGQVPHRDFSTPIGVASFAPLALMQWLGAGPGMAFVLGQVLVALAVLPAVWWAGISRMRGIAAWIFGATVMILVMALMYGGTDPGLSVAMHYNRWSWALAYIGIALAVLPPQMPTRPGVDGAILGLVAAALALIKVTFFVAFLLPILVALLLRGAWRSLGFALIAGLAVAVVATLPLGLSFWTGYFGDLIAVAGTSTRAAPGLPIGQVISAPAYMAGSVLAFAAVILLRAGGHGREGLTLLLLIPGFFYVTWQNFGNDPLWLALVAVLLLNLPSRVEEVTGHAGAQTIAATVTLALAAPTLINLTFSPLRNLSADATIFAPFVDDTPDFRGQNNRLLRVDARIAYEDSIPELVPLVTEKERIAPVSFQGKTLPRCSAVLGYGALQRAMATQLHAGGLTDAAGIYVADVLSALWMYGPFRPLKGGAPWHYGGLPGLEDANYVLVPLCPIAPENRAEILMALEARGQTLEEAQRTDLFVLYRLP